MVVDSITFRFSNGDIKYYIVSNTAKALYQPLPSTLITGMVPFANGANNGSAATSATTGTMTVSMSTSAITVTPSAACTFNASGGIAGQRVTFIITTSGTSSFTLTWGTNFKTVGTLATGILSGKVFCVSFVCKDGTTWAETGRTTAM